MWKKLSITLIIILCIMLLGAFLNSYLLHCSEQEAREYIRVKYGKEITVQYSYWCPPTGASNVVTFAKDALNFEVYRGDRGQLLDSYSSYFDAAKKSIEKGKVPKLSTYGK